MRASCLRMPQREKEKQSNDCSQSCEEAANLTDVADHCGHPGCLTPRAERLFSGCNFFVEEEDMRSIILAAVAIATLLLCVACSSNSRDKTSYKDRVKKALEQAELTDIS